MLVESNYLTMAYQALLYGGSDCSIYCEGNPVETASGQDPIIASGVINKVLTMLKNAIVYIRRVIYEFKERSS